MSPTMTSPEEAVYTQDPPSTNEVEALDRRRHTRFATQQPLTVSHGPWYSKRKLKGAVLDWGESGIRFQANDNDFFANNGTHPLKVEMPNARSGGVYGTVVRSAPTSEGLWQYGIRFNKSLQQHEEDRKNEFKKFTVFLFTIAFIVALTLIKMQHVKWFWYDPIFRLYTLTTAAFIGSRMLFSLLYKEPQEVGYLPSISVIVAVKNEADNIAETVHHCFKSNYPKDRFEVMVIDDGSTDNTWDVLDSLRSSYPKLSLIKFPENKGKRHAMAAGATQATGEILVYVDSDSFVEPEGIYKLVQPFHNPSVGAVAGHTRVRVQAENVISKMESVRYYVSHQIFKSAEGLFAAVTCCPGAFSAYRREVIMKVLPAWLNQKFMGVQATFGDDRSLTNFVLKTHQVLYHAGAVAYTYVPQTWMQFFRQQLRWKKSWARETTIAARILYKKHPLAAISYYLANIITVCSPIVFLRAMIYASAWGAPILPYLYGVFMVYFALCIYYYLFTYESHWYCGLLFAFVYMTVLCWQTYYAILTINRTHWGTR